MLLTVPDLFKITFAIVFVNPCNANLTPPLLRGGGFVSHQANKDGGVYYVCVLRDNPLLCEHRLRSALLWGDKSPVVASNALFALPPLKRDSSFITIAMLIATLCNANFNSSSFKGRWIQSKL